MSDVPENLGLLALMLLHDSRRETRTDGKGDLVLLEEQDRTLWDHAQIGEGVAYLERALRMRQPGSYQLQAAIAALHARAKTPAETDWPQIAALYRELAARQPSATVALNHAVAVAMSEGASKGLQLLDCANANGALDSYHLYHAARADLLRREARREEACEAYRKALELTGNAVEQRYLQYRLTSLCKEL
jgi:RNA polymerase sigma-70 factor (ECF subfamily)